MRTIFDDLNAELEPFASWDEVTVGSVVAARYCGEYHRAKVIDVLRSANRYSYRVRIMDFGMFAEVHFGDLRQLLGVAAKYVELPPRVFECRLAEVQPSSMASDKGVWTTESVSAFGELIKGMTTDVCVEVSYCLQSSNGQHTFLRFVLHSDLFGGREGCSCCADCEWRKC